MTENEKKTIERMYDGTEGNIGYACLYPNDGGARKEFVFDLTPQNIANFLGKHQYDASKIVLTDMLDRLVLNTIGGFIDRCPNQALLQQIMPVLIPIQMGDTEPQEFPVVSRDAFEEYSRMEDEMVTGAELGLFDYKNEEKE